MFLYHLCLVILYHLCLVIKTDVIDCCCSFPDERLITAHQRWHGQLLDSQPKQSCQQLLMRLDLILT